MSHNAPSIAPNITARRHRTETALPPDQRFPVPIFVRARDNQDEVNQGPYPAPAERQELGNPDSRASRVKAVNPQITQKQAQQERRKPILALGAPDADTAFHADLRLFFNDVAARAAKLLIRVQPD